MPAPPRQQKRERHRPGEVAEQDRDASRYNGTRISASYAEPCGDSRLRNSVSASIRQPLPRSRPSIVARARCARPPRAAAAADVLDARDRQVRRIGRGRSGSMPHAAQPRADLAVQSRPAAARPVGDAHPDHPQRPDGGNAPNAGDAQRRTPAPSTARRSASQHSAAARVGHLAEEPEGQVKVGGGTQRTPRRARATRASSDRAGVGHSPPPTAAATRLWIELKPRRTSRSQLASSIRRTMSSAACDAWNLTMRRGCRGTGTCAPCAGRSARHGDARRCRPASRRAAARAGDAGDADADVGARPRADAFGHRRPRPAR